MGCNMATVNVYSKLRTDVEMRLYKNKTEKAASNINVTNSIVLNKVIIQGVTRYLHSNGKKITLLNQLAKTEVDKDLWEKIVAENGEGNTLLKNKQIFAAKNDAEAHQIAAEAPAFIADMLTREDFKKKMKTNKVKLM